MIHFTFEILPENDWGNRGMVLHNIFITEVIMYAPHLLVLITQSLIFHFAGLFYVFCS